MSDTHIHIHLSGDAAEAATTAAPAKARSRKTSSSPKPKKAKKKVSSYHRSYGKHFKRLQGKNKKKDGSWKKGGFKATQKAAHKAAKR